MKHALIIALCGFILLVSVQVYAQDETVVEAGIITFAKSNICEEYPDGYEFSFMVESEEQTMFYGYNAGKDATVTIEASGVRGIRIIDFGQEAIFPVPEATSDSDTITHTFLEPMRFAFWINHGSNVGEVNVTVSCGEGMQQASPVDNNNDTYSDGYNTALLPSNWIITSDQTDDAKVILIDGQPAAVVFFYPMREENDPKVFPADLDALTDELLLMDDATYTAIFQTSVRVDRIEPLPIDPDHGILTAGVSGDRTVVSALRRFADTTAVYIVAISDSGTLESDVLSFIESARPGEIATSIDEETVTSIDEETVTSIDEETVTSTDEETEGISEDSISPSAEVDTSENVERVAYITVDGELIVADADFLNPTVIDIDLNERILFSRISPDGTQIAFVAGATIGQPNIYKVNVDGSNLMALTDTGRDLFPDWTPDGQRIVFMSARDGNPGNGGEIYIMDADGNNLQRLTTNDADEQEPTVSPDGQSIYFASNRGGSYQTYQMSIDGGNATILFSLPATAKNSGKAVACADGETLIATLYVENNPQLYVFNITNGELTQLTTGGNIDENPSCSPDSQEVLFERGDRLSPVQLFTINIDGTNLRSIVQGAQYASWSGSIIDQSEAISTNDTLPRIVYITPDEEIASVFTDGTDVQILTEPGDYRFPRWSPDGTRIAYYQSGDPRSYIVMNSDGSEARSVAECKGGFCSGVTWSPDSTRIAYVTSDQMTSATVNIITLETGEIQVIDPDFFGFTYTSPQWSPDGRTIAFTAIDGGAEFLALADVTTGTARLTDFGDETGIFTNGLIWIDESQTVAVGDSRFSALFSLQQGDALQPLEDITEDFAGGLERIFVDGRIRFQNNGTFRIVDANGNLLETIEVDGSDPHWQPDPRPTQSTVTVQCDLLVSQSINLRTGPGTNFAIARTVSNETLTGVAQLTDSGGFIWWKTDENNWARMDVIEERGDCNSLPIVSS